MAAILDALAHYVKNLITDMAQEEVSVLLGVSDEITKLEDNMESIKAFLADAERRRITDQSVQRWVRRLKDAMYDATDILDLCQLEADKRKEVSEGGMLKEKVPGCFQPLLFCLWNPVFAHEMGSHIKELNWRLDDIYKEADRFKFSIGLGSNPEPSKLLTDAEKTIQKMSSEFNQSAIVGEKIERDTKELVQVLLCDDNLNIKVVCIIGTGGMGKTTLAQKIFSEKTIHEEFKVKIWLSITKHCDHAELLRTAIEHAGGAHGGARDKTLLQRTLTDTLSKGRFILVLDDMWSEDAWSHVLSVPVRNASQKQPGSRVLVTTRLEDLAQKMRESLHQHHVSPLDNNDAWSLLKKQLPPNQVVGIDQLKNIGMEILERCDGLPLAIKVMGGLLSTRYPSESEWKVVSVHRAWLVVGLPQDLDNRLYLSYEDLSPQVKQCFLFCSLFPKGEKIIKDVVTLMWISEGFIQLPDESRTTSNEYGLEEIATEYYQELIKRNLIEPAQGYSLTGYECTMHDVVRSFAEYMAREESVVVVDDKQAAICGRREGMHVRHLSVGHVVSAVEWAVLKRMESLRTLIINSRISYQHGDLLSSLSSLRVLSIRSADSDSLVATVSKLKHLRYLRLENTDISSLPDDIHNMKFLQHIVLSMCEKLGHLPGSIVKLVQLRTLVLTGSNISAVPKGFGRLTNLRSLCGFPVHVDMEASWCSLQELEPLSQLRDLVLDGLEKTPASWVAEKAMISSKGHLSYLVLNYSAVPCGVAEQQQQQSVIEDILEMLCPPICLENLIVSGGYVGRKMPNWMHAPASADFKSLRYLQLENLPYCTQLPDGLCCLPCLELLTIKDAPAVKSIGPEFQSSSPLAAGNSAAISAPFPKLRRLQLDRLCEWEEWEWNGCEDQRDMKAVVMAMPCLETLRIQNCMLIYLPPGLTNTKRHDLRQVYLYSLTNIEIVENLPSVVELDVFNCPKLKRVSGLFRLHKVRIARCPNVEVLEGVPSLDSLELWNATMEALPGFLQAVSPRYLELHCSKKLFKLLSPGSSEWNKIIHIGKQNISYIEA